MSKFTLVPQVKSDAAGNTVATTAGAAAASINISGLGYILITCEIGKELFIKPYASAAAAPADAALMHFSAEMNGFILNVYGCDRIRHLRKGAADVTWYYTPLANT